MIYISTGIALIMAVTMFFYRMRETERPVNERKILLPPLFMSTGALMFIFPIFRLTVYEVLEALFVGIIFSIFLIKTSKFELRDNQIYIHRSKTFMFILVGLIMIRLLAKTILGATIEFGILSGMSFILALGMIIPWRIVMYFQYKKVKNEYVTNGKMA